jgi:hypothetical protein
MKDRRTTLVECQPRDKKSTIFSSFKSTSTNSTQKQQQGIMPTGRTTTATSTTLTTSKGMTRSNSNINHSKTVICPFYRNDLAMPSSSRFFHRQDSMSILSTSSSSDYSDSDHDNDDNGNDDDDVSCSTTDDQMMSMMGGSATVETRKGGSSIETNIVKEEVITQGYINKKGSGQDWLGSKTWKSRWAVLVVRIALYYIFTCCNLNWIFHSPPPDWGSSNHLHRGFHLFLPSFFLPPAITHPTKHSERKLSVLM